MDLQQYHAKRKFQETPEPRGTVKPGVGPLHFAVQKHHASRMHFDLRLELDGTLKSWAVPKGPSIVLEEKRLAVMVEDHPLDYMHFEGIIPKGNYGAGTVMVWDAGTYHVIGITNRQKSEQAIREGMRQGRLHLVLHGQRLKGEYGLIRMKKDDEKNWLFFKKGVPGLQRSGEDRSVLSGRTMDEIARSVKFDKPNLEFDLSDAPTAPMPRAIKPMLATPVATPFDNAGWLFELKWDGYRAIAEINQKRVRLYSRNHRSFEKRFVTIVESLEHLGHDAVLDGEIVALDEHGRPNFHFLQEHSSARKGSLVFEVFDVLHLDGHDLRNRPLLRRQEILAQLVADLPNVRCSKPIPENGRAFFDAVSANRLEGIVAKESSSKYREGVRSKSWLKIKTRQRQEAVIAGFTEPKGSRNGLGALVLGVYEKGDLIHIGDAGSGFTEKELGNLRARLDKLEQKTCPFKKRPKPKGKVHWVKPLLVCEVTFADWTDDSHIRHPVFEGLREDKDPSTVEREIPQRLDLVVTNVAVETGKSSRAVVERIDTKPRPNRQETIGGHTVSLTNQHKVYWPNDGYTKGDLVIYYREVAGFILPYLNNRPLSLNRHPNGIHGESFFQRDVSNQPPPTWVETAELTSDGKRVRSVLCQDEATLVYLANLGCIELNPWNSRVGTLDLPDYVLLDLDPEDISFESVIETAQAIHKVLDRIGAESYCKTSGKRGLHIYIPFGAQHGHEQAKHFAELIANIVHAKLPLITSLVRSPGSRQGRVYLDYLQNGKGKTLSAAYSARPYPGATVSTPLKWTEVRRGLDPATFTISTMPKRLSKVDDLWKAVLGPGIDLPACLERLASLLKKTVI